SGSVRSSDFSSASPRSASRSPSSLEGAPRNSSLLPRSRGTNRRRPSGLRESRTPEGVATFLSEPPIRRRDSHGDPNVARPVRPRRGPHRWTGEARSRRDPALPRESEPTRVPPGPRGRSRRREPLVHEGSRGVGPRHSAEPAPPEADGRAGPSVGHARRRSRRFPGAVDDRRIASALTQSCLGRPVDMVRARNGITIPAEADYVLEGRLTGETHDEGPFVDAVRTYDRVRKEPVLVVERVSQRKDAVFHIIVGGLDEHFLFMGMPREPVIFQAVSRAVPHVGAVRLTEGGCAWLHGVVSIRKQHQGDGKNAIMAAFGAHTSMKRVVIVDEDINVFDDRDVEWAIATR